MQCSPKKVAVKLFLILYVTKRNLLVLKKIRNYNVTIEFRINSYKNVKDIKLDPSFIRLDKGKGSILLIFRSGAKEFPAETLTPGLNSRNVVASVPILL